MAVKAEDLETKHASEREMQATKDKIIVALNQKALENTRRQNRLGYGEEPDGRLPGCIFIPEKRVLASRNTQMDKAGDITSSRNYVYQQTSEHTVDFRSKLSASIPGISSFCLDIAADHAKKLTKSKMLWVTEYRQVVDIYGIAISESPQEESLKGIDIDKFIKNYGSRCRTEETYGVSYIVMIEIEEESEDVRNEFTAKLKGYNLEGAVTYINAHKSKTSTYTVWYGGGGIHFRKAPDNGIHIDLKEIAVWKQEVANYFCNLSEGESYAVLQHEASDYTIRPFDEFSKTYNNLVKYQQYIVRGLERIDRLCRLIKVRISLQQKQVEEDIATARVVWDELNGILSKDEGIRERIAQFNTRRVALEESRKKLNEIVTNRTGYSKGYHFNEFTMGIKRGPHTPEKHYPTSKHHIEPVVIDIRYSKEVSVTLQQKDGKVLDDFPLAFAATKSDLTEEDAANPEVMITRLKTYHRHKGNALMHLHPTQTVDRVRAASLHRSLYMLYPDGTAGKLHKKIRGDLKISDFKSSHERYNAIEESFNNHRIVLDIKDLDPIEPVSPVAKLAFTKEG